MEARHKSAAKYYDALQYFNNDFIFHSDQNISCKLSSVFLMIKRLNGGIPEKKGLKSFRHLSCMFFDRQSFKERLLAV